MNLRTLASAPIKKGTRVLVRIDADVQLRGKNILPADAFRLAAAIPTLKYLLRRGAVLTIMAHRGRPAGKKVRALSLAPAQKFLEQKLHVRLKFLPNTRFDGREEKNDPTYAAELARGQDLFVFDAFATAHRAHASTVGVARLLPTYLGLQITKELAALTAVRQKPRTPLMVVVGGVKAETKLPLIKYFLPRAEKIFIGGALATSGVLLGKKSAAHKIILPTDFVYQAALARDVGPISLALWQKELRRAHTIIWNGPLGKFEEPRFARGTVALAKFLHYCGRHGATVVAGGGETVSAILQAHAQAGYTHISTGGGAMLDFLSGARLPILTQVQSKL